MDNEERPFRILALDGGGIQGAFTASVLAEIEQNLPQGKRLVDHFDLIAGTSTGGIIAIALAFGKSAQEIRDFYKNQGHKIFPTENPLTSFCYTLKRYILAAPYSGDTLQEEVETVVGSNTFQDAEKRLIITSYNASRGNVHIFKHMLSGDQSVIQARGYDWCQYRRFDPVQASVLAVATSSAPTFFQAKMIQELGGEFIDGGIWANCPILPAIAEATGPLGKKLDSLRVLSIGTRFERVKVNTWNRASGVIPWLVKGGGISIIMNAQAAGAIGTARVLLGDPSRQHLYRVDDERKNTGEKRTPKLSVDKVKDVPGIIQRGKEVFEEEKMD